MSAPIRITIVDEAPGAGRREALRLELASRQVTPRELIERRVRHEVAEYGRKSSETFFGLVQPTDTERALNGWRFQRLRPIDPDAQVAAALDAFARGRILLLVDDRQAEALDEPLTLRPDAEVCFYKLVPLVGG
jgi:hypothetical protein